jgi:hypothetical protein
VDVFANAIDANAVETKNSSIDTQLSVGTMFNQSSYVQDNDPSTAKDIFEITLNLQYDGEGGFVDVVYAEGTSAGGVAQWAFYQPLSDSPVSVINLGSTGSLSYSLDTQNTGYDQNLILSSSGSGGTSASDIYINVRYSRDFGLNTLI